jgi:hypothetical protein
VKGCVLVLPVAPRFGLLCIQRHREKYTEDRYSMVGTTSTVQEVLYRKALLFAPTKIKPCVVTNATSEHASQNIAIRKGVMQVFQF